MKKKAIDLSEFAVAWGAPYVERQCLREFSGGALNSRTAANHDSRGDGIKGRIRMGRKILYPVQEVIAWMEARSTKPETGKVGDEAEQL